MLGTALRHSRHVDQKVVSNNGDGDVHDHEDDDRLGGLALGQDVQILAATGIASPGPPSGKTANAGWG